MTITINGTTIGQASSGAEVEVSDDQYAQIITINELIKEIRSLRFKNG